MNKTLNHFGIAVTHDHPQLTINKVFLAYKIVCLDGAINKLKNYFESLEKSFPRGPDFIIGDFDSIDPESIKWLNDTVN